MPSKLRNLSEALTRYGETSMVLHRAVKTLGGDILAALPVYLGDNAKVYGVPPSGNWKARDYRDAAFSAYHSDDYLRVSPQQMGVAIGIPHILDSGTHWVRIVLEFEKKAGMLSVRVGDSELQDVPVGESGPKIDAICELIYRYLLASFDDPVQMATSVKGGKIGFLR